MIMLHIGSMLHPTISLKSPFKDSLDTWEKEFCLQTIHTGVNKKVSNNSDVEFYQTVIKPQNHETVL